MTAQAAVLSNQTLNLNADALQFVVQSEVVLAQLLNVQIGWGFASLDADLGLQLAVLVDQILQFSRQLLIVAAQLLVDENYLLDFKVSLMHSCSQSVAFKG